MLAANYRGKFLSLLHSYKYMVVVPMPKENRETIGDIAFSNPACVVPNEEMSILNLEDIIDVDHIAVLLQKFANAKALLDGKRIHDHIVKNGLSQDRFLGNLLIHMYGKCGALEEGMKVFQGMQRKNSFSWNIMIAAYAQHGLLEEARHLYHQMPQQNVVAGNTMIAAYAQQGQIKEALQILQGLPCPNVISWTTMMACYAHQGQLEQALAFFEHMPRRNVISWNTAIAACLQHGETDKAIDLFWRMPERNVVSWNAIISAFTQQGDLEQALTLFQQMPEQDVVSWNVMITAYAQYGQLDEAIQMFERMPWRNVVSWNTMVAAYVQHGYFKEAVHFFQQMPQWDSASWNTIIAAFVQYGQLDEATDLLFQMPHKDVISWNALISAYAQQAEANQAFCFFQGMQIDSIKPDKVTYISLVDACAKASALVQGKRMHAHIMNGGFEKDVAISNALVNMYGKSGCLRDACSVFEKMSTQNTVSWNTIIGALAQHGHGNEAIKMFTKMKLNGVLVDIATFVNLLSACTYAGLIEEGCHYFVSMGKDSLIFPMIEHYNCFINLLGRAGQSGEAEVLINDAPFEADITCWRALLGSCRVYSSVAQGRRAAKHVFKLDPQNASSYVLLSNIYAAGEWLDEHFD